MSHLTSTSRVVLLVISALWWMEGCKPVADTTTTPLPTQTIDEPSVDTSKPADDAGDEVDALEVVQPVEADTMPADEPNGRDSTTTVPTDDGPADSAATDPESGESTPAPDVSIDTGVPADVDGTQILADSNNDESETAVADDATNDQVVDERPTMDESGDLATLTIGNPAPPLQIAQWIKGEEVGQFKAGQVYVVEFWATWCGPCRTSMPHISQLQQDHRDTVTFMGITRENEETVRDFMGKVQDEASGKTWDDVVQYTIALDRNNETNNAYMKAAEQNGIPTAFIVGKDGVIEWMGHPMLIDQPIAQVLSDDWDRQAALAKLEADRAMEQVQREVSIAARGAKETGDWTGVLQMVEKMVLKNPESSGMKIMQFNVLIAAEKYEDLNRVADELSAQVWDDANYLNRIAWQMVTRVPQEQQDLELALKIALRSLELAEQNPSVMDTLARVYYEMGDRDNAIQWQKRAVEAAPNESTLSDTLKKYEAEGPER